MAAEYDATEFIDSDFEAHKTPSPFAATTSTDPLRAPTREEVDRKVVEAQQKLAELKRATRRAETLNSRGVAGPWGRPGGT